MKKKLLEQLHSCGSGFSRAHDNFFFRGYSVTIPEEIKE
jgi:hypothetical protein